MMHYKEELKDYVLLMLGAPVVAVNLSKEELNFCIEKPVEFCQKSKLTGVVNIQVLTHMVQEGALALGRYIVAKKKFSQHSNTWFLTPDEDGFAEMTQADSDWNEFVNKVTHFRLALRKNNGPDAEPVA